VNLWNCGKQFALASLLQRIDPPQAQSKFHTCPDMNERFLINHFLLLKLLSHSGSSRLQWHLFAADEQASIINDFNQVVVGCSDLRASPSAKSGAVTCKASAGISGYNAFSIIRALFNRNSISQSLSPSTLVLLRELAPDKREAFRKQSRIDSFLIDLLLELIIQSENLLADSWTSSEF